ncbi:MAG: primosomal protein N' [Oscillospiraceae bacterium]|jgi:primosomal protein N' (replication factor Y)|nr:primosomal protein N' [Oscillospiraceae bacterium]
MYARLALEAAEYAFDMPYEYKIPDGMYLAPGMRVTVPFGRGNRKYCAMTLAVQDEPTTDKHKLIAEVLDAQPLLDDKMIKTALWLHKTVCCSVWQAICAMLPAGLRHARMQFLSLIEGEERAGESPPLSEDAAIICAHLSKGKPSIALNAISSLLAGRDGAPAVKELTDAGICEVSVNIKRRAADKTETLISLAIPPEEAQSALGTLKGIRQKDVIKALIENGPLSMAEIGYLTGASPVSVRRLESLKLVSQTEHEVYRRPALQDVSRAPAPDLTPGQSDALTRLSALLDAEEPSCALLHGVTGSGKTNVYLALMERVVASGGTCLILAPEIALTPQLLERISARFGDRVALLHSGLSIGERMDEWKRVRTGKCDVVVGTRSAVFAPLENLRLIILDEEHETSYKSETAPRYHAREAAKFRAVQNRALLVLGSATPSIESMYAAQCGQYTYIELPARYHGGALPAVSVADMAGELREGNTGVISAPLYEELKANLLRGEQTILFLNRRGASKYVICADCNTAPECPRCSRYLVYHSVSGRLHCHLCGHSEKLSETCARCGGELKTVGAGTQRVEDELKELFPNTPILRLDADTTMRKNSAQKILREFSERRVPILVGTQMVAKGLDFPGVTLVGVINADAALWAADFRAHEKTFALLTQVVGRGGRGDKPGRAILQSYSGMQPTLIDAAAQDYHSFYGRELELRRMLSLPPFTFITRLCFFGAKQDDVLKACLRVRGWVERWLRGGESDAKVLGPAQAQVLKVNLRYRYHLTLTAGKKESLRALAAAVMKAFPKDKQNRGVGLYADPDAEEA